MSKLAPSTAPTGPSGVFLMRKRALDAEIRSLIEPLAVELAALVRKAALLAVEEALEPARRASKRGELIPVPPRPRPASGPAKEPLSLDHYERLVLLHALAECKGDALAAADLLRIGKSSMYRKMRDHGIPRTRGRTVPPIRPDDSIPGPVSLKAYERHAVERALAEAGGSTLKAAKLLHVSKSSMYRMVEEHGLK